MSGKSQKPPPSWVMLLEATKGNPLEAQRAEEELTRRWYNRWLFYYTEQAKAAQKAAKPAKG